MQELEVVELFSWLYALLPLIVIGFVLTGSVIILAAWGVARWR